MMEILIKSGTGNYSDYDGCDMLVKRIEDNTFPIPRIGESIEILEDNDQKRTNDKGVILKEYHQYFVTDVHYWINENAHGVMVYVVPIGRNALKEI